MAATEEEEEEEEEEACLAIGKEDPGPLGRLKAATRIVVVIRSRTPRWPPEMKGGG